MSEEATLDEFVEDVSSESTEVDAISVSDLQQLEESPIESWKLVKLGDILSLEYGDNLPEDSRDSGNIPVYGSNGRVDTHSEPAVDKSGIILGRKGSIGEIEFSNRPFWPIDTTYYITDGETDENLRFLHHLLQNIQLERLNAASAIPGLNRNDTYGLNAVIPPLEEQRKIATVLHNIDQAIQKTTEIIEKSWKLKKGLVQELLTQGSYDHQTYEGYRLGPIEMKKPRDWGLIEFNEFSSKIKDGPHITPEYTDEGIPFVSSQNVNPFSNKFDYSQYEKYISTETYKDINQNCRPERGDIIMSRRATIGPTQLIRHNKQFAFFVGVAIIKTDDTIYNPFLEQLMNWSVMVNLWHLKSPGSTMKTLNLGTIRGQNIPLPSIGEQKEITGMLQSVDKQITSNKKTKYSLQRLKKALMQDLLSGKVRTTDTSIAIPDEIQRYG